jgi:predicted site-specific integrase-resolvase
MAKRTGIVKNKTAQGIGNPRLLPLKDAAQWLGLTVWAMRERIWAGQIPVVQFPNGRKQYIDIMDLEKFIQKNKRIIT